MNPLTTHQMRIRRRFLLASLVARGMQWLPPHWFPRVVIVDIDGTLTDEDKALSLDAIQALRKLEKNGIPVVFATGNVRPVAYGLWRFIGLTAPMCCENGGVIWHHEWDKPIIRASKEEARLAANWLAQRIPGLNPDGIATNQWRESEWCLYPEENVEAITAQLAQSPWRHLHVVRTGFAIHLMEPDLSKGEGLKAMFERMNWSLDDALAVGDAPNDLSMFEVVHWSVAVGGAFEEVSQAASVRSPFLRGETLPPLVEAILQAKTKLT